MNDSKEIFQSFLELVTAVICTLLICESAGAATITRLESIDEFTSKSIITNDFESTINTPEFRFDSTAFLAAASFSTGGVTSSGTRGLAENRGHDPLVVFLPGGAFEVGMYFGNDDFNLIFDVTLGVFDSRGSYLGWVRVPSNGNDFADQFIGLRSDTEFNLVALFYERPQAQGLSLFIDDFTIGVGATVAEPSASMLVIAGLLGIFACRRRAGLTGRSLNALEVVGAIPIPILAFSQQSERRPSKLVNRTSARGAPDVKIPAERADSIN